MKRRSSRYRCHSNQILVKAKRILFYSRFLKVHIPIHQESFPRAVKQIVIETKQLARAIERSTLLAKDGKHVVKLTTRDEKIIQLTSNTPEVGRVVEQVMAEELSGEELNISFNARYVLDALKAIDSEQVLIKFTGAMSPFVLKPIDMKIHYIWSCLCAHIN